MKKSETQITKYLCLRNLNGLYIAKGGCGSVWADVLTMARLFEPAEARSFLEHWEGESLYEVNAEQQIHIRTEPLVLEHEEAIRYVLEKPEALNQLFIFYSDSHGRSYANRHYQWENRHLTEICLVYDLFPVNNGKKYFKTCLERRRSPMAEERSIQQGGQDGYGIETLMDGLEPYVGGTWYKGTWDQMIRTGKAVGRDTMAYVADRYGRFGFFIEDWE